MKKIIIGIHGLGNKPDREILEQWWLASLNDGLVKAGFNNREVPFELVYWADLLHPQPLDQSIKDPHHPLYVEDPYLPVKTNDKNDPPGKLRQRIVDYLGDQLEKIFLNKDLTINFSSVSDFVLNHFFGDLAVYYSTLHKGRQLPNPDQKEAIRATLRQKLSEHRKKEILLIAHSMGAIIAYDVLSNLDFKVKIHTLVTIGSPLGLPIIRGKIAAEHSETDNPKEKLKTPEMITHNWYNLADIRDKIALYYRLGDDFSANSRGIRVEDKIVLNGYRQLDGDHNPHKAFGYLSTIELADIVSAFLGEKSRSFFSGKLAAMFDWFKSKPIGKATYPEI